jgi:hypothetical protein
MQKSGIRKLYIEDEWRTRKEYKRKVGKKVFQEERWRRKVNYSP